MCDWKNKALPYTAALFAAAHWASTPMVYGAQGAYGFATASERSTNIRQVPINQESERINSVVGGLVYSEDTADFTGRIVTQIEYRDYTHDTFDDESIFTLDTSALWTISPGRFTWTIVDSARQVVLDPTQPRTPPNRAGANVIETGPDIFFHLGPRQRLSFGARYGNVYVGDTELDNNRYGGVIRWIHQIGPQLTGSANFEHLSVQYDDDVNEDFERRDAFLRMETQRVHTRITVDGGITRINRDRSSELDGSLFRLRAEHDVTGSSSFGMSALVGYSDVGDGLLRYVTPPTTPLDRATPPSSITDVIASGIDYSREADLTYGYRGARFNTTARIEGRELEFETAATGNRDETGVVLDLAYSFSPRMSGTLFGREHDIEYRETGRDDEETEVGIGLAYRAQRNLTVATDARRIERTSNVPTADFVDRRIFVTLIYSTGSLYRPITRR